jgi:hypothetical protein
MIVNRPAEARRGQGPVDAEQLTRDQQRLSPGRARRPGEVACVNQFVTVHAGKSQQPMVDGLEQDISHGCVGLAVRLARLLEAKLGQSVVEPDSRSWRRPAKPSGKHDVFDDGKYVVLIDAGGSHKNPSMVRCETRIWRDWRPTVAHAGHIVVPPLPV